jgi:hypothetical protein
MEIADILKERLQGKQLIGYGAGMATLGTIRTTPLKLSYIVDDTLALQGQTISGVPIKSPACLTEVDKDSNFIIVFAYQPKSILAIQKRLDCLGFDYLRNWIDCSFFHYGSIKTRLQDSFGIQGDPALFSKTRTLSLYNSIENLSAIAGTWLFEELVKKLHGKVAGSVAELGVYKGGNALISLLLLGEEIQNRSYHLFDSLAGFPEFSPYDPLSRAGEFTDTSIACVRNLFSNFSNVRLHVGFFSDTLDNVCSENFALVYVDCDLYEPTIECCEFFYERLNPGGVMLFHDYCAPENNLPHGVKILFTGVKKAVDDFFFERPENLVTFPETTHALIVKR